MGKKNEDALKIEALKEAIVKKVEEAKGQIEANYENSLCDLNEAIEMADKMIHEFEKYESFPLAVIELANVLLSLKMRKRQQEMQAAQYFKQAMQQGCKGCSPDSCQHAPK